MFVSLTVLCLFHFGSETNSVQVYEGTILMKIIFIAFFILTLASCGGSGTDSIVIEPIDSSAPESNSPDINTYPGVIWETFPAADVGMSQSAIDQALEYAFESSRNTQGVVIVRHGVVVAERYANGSSQDSLATSWSTGKSFASALIGIALKQEFLDSIDVPAETYLTEWADTNKTDITLRAILEMRSGLGKAAKGDSNIYTSGGISGDQLAYALDRHPETIARTDNWAYQNTDSMLIGGILEAATGQPLADFADTYLFSKIGMSATWWTDEVGNVMTYCCIDATSRDFARFGLLFARDGRWQDEQIITAQWVTDSTTVPTGTNNPYYALQWWVEPAYGYFYSAGLHQNNIYVYPQYDLVIVRNSSYTKIGDEAIRSEANYHSTLAPSNWSDADFLTPIINAINQ